jgi:hypothetical protein
MSAMYGLCTRCGQHYYGPDAGCPDCDPETAGNNMRLPHAPDVDCWDMECPMCCHLFVDAEDLPEGYS